MSNRSLIKTVQSSNIISINGAMIVLSNIETNNGTVNAVGTELYSTITYPVSVIGDKVKIGDGLYCEGDLEFISFRRAGAQTYYKLIQITDAEFNEEGRWSSAECIDYHREASTTAILPAPHMIFKVDWEYGELNLPKNATLSTQYGIIVNDARGEDMFIKDYNEYEITIYSVNGVYYIELETVNKFFPVL